MEQRKSTYSSLFLERLPPELVRAILSHLSASELTCVGSTCRALASHALDDLLWADIINARLPHRIKDPGIFRSFRRLYLAYHPCWFIPEHKIWFADNEPTGNLILARYDNRRGVIEGYRILAERGHPALHFWNAEPTVLIQSFDPSVRLSLDEPTLFLKDPNPTSQAAPIQDAPRRGARQMPLALEAHNVYSSLSFCSTKQIQQDPLADSEDYWPPPIIPSNARTVRRVRGKEPEHIERMADLSEQSFRINKWTSFRIAFSPGTHQLYSTYSTLHPSVYTPTSEKPYQGIWVGDYSAHGCEFLLVLQSDVDQAQQDDSVDENDAPEDMDMEPGQRGRLECIKLTGDMNVPRGQYSWLSDDIGPRGLVKVAEDDPFKGARIVRSKGHVAGIGFQDDIFIQSQLILISADLIAHYWKEMGHVSYFRRVDIDALLQI